MDKILRYLSRHGALIFGMLMAACAIKTFFSLLVSFTMYNLVWFIIYGGFAMYNLNNYFRRR